MIKRKKYLKLDFKKIIFFFDLILNLKIKALINSLILSKF